MITGARDSIACAPNMSMLLVWCSIDGVSVLESIIKAVARSAAQ